VESFSPTTTYTGGVVFSCCFGGGVLSRQGAATCAFGEALWIRDCSVFSLAAVYFSFLFLFFVCMLVFGFGGGWYKVRCMELVLNLVLWCG
jgi:hypothetical protein